MLNLFNMSSPAIFAFGSAKSSKFSCVVYSTNKALPPVGETEICGRFGASTISIIFCSGCL